MRVDRTAGEVWRVTLSRRNLRALLAKLDGYPDNSLLAIIKDGVLVVAEEDAEHYGSAVPGVMHPDTEAHL